MKKVIRFLGLPLNVLAGVLSALILLCIILVAPSEYLPSPIGSLMDLIDKGGRIVSLVTVGLSVAYILIGIVNFLAGALRKKKVEDMHASPKRMALRGVLGIGISLLLYFVLHTVLGFFGFLPAGLPLPQW